MSIRTKTARTQILIRYIGVIFLPLILLLLGCSSCKIKPKTGTVTGSVALVNDSGNPANDPIDNSDVVVAIYGLAELDSTLVRLNGEYPQIGVQISQATEFDHRTSKMLKSTRSNPEGLFNIEGVEPGNYNLAIFKEHWGVRYLYNIRVDANTPANLGNIQMHPVRSLDTTIIEDITFASDYTYHIDMDVSIIGNTIIDPRAQIFIDPGKRLTFHGNVSTPLLANMADAWRIKSSKDLYSETQITFDADDYYYTVEFSADNAQVQGGIFQHVNSGITLIGQNIDFSNSIIRNCVNGLSVRAGGSSIRNIIATDAATSGLSINYNNTQTSEISHSIVSNTHTGVRINSLGTYSISNSYFNNCWQAIVPSICTGSIRHNAFDANVSDIAQELVQIATEISYNNFFWSKAWGITPSKRAVINNNNFFKADYFYIDIRGGGLYNSICSGDIDATNNYWSVSDVGPYLRDAEDNDQYPDAPCAFFVHFLPRRSSRLAGAGIH